MKKIFATANLLLAFISIFVSAQSTQSFSVKIIGEGKPMIFMPGIYCRGKFGMKQFNSTNPYINAIY